RCSRDHGQVPRSGRKCDWAVSAAGLGLRCSNLEAGALVVGQRLGGRCSRAPQRDVFPDVAAAMQNGDRCLESPEDKEDKDCSGQAGGCLRIAAATDNDSKNADQEDDLDERGKERDHRMAGIEIAAGGEEDRAQDHALLVLENQAAATAGVEAGSGRLVYIMYNNTIP